MRISEQGINLLMEREGKRNEAYLDSRGIPTIGVGHTGPEVHMGLVWTDAQVAEIFRNDIKSFEDAINAAIKKPLLQNQYDAIISWAFNVGITAATTSTLIRKVNEGNLAEVPAQFDRWHIPEEITSRRNGEREQFKGTKFVARA